MYKFSSRGSSNAENLKMSGLRNIVLEYSLEVAELPPHERLVYVEGLGNYSVAGIQLELVRLAIKLHE